MSSGENGGGGRPTTRNITNRYITDCFGVGRTSDTISVKKLPLKRDVLKYLLYLKHKKTQENNGKDAATDSIISCPQRSGCSDIKCEEVCIPSGSPCVVEATKGAWRNSGIEVTTFFISIFFFIL